VGILVELCDANSLVCVALTSTQHREETESSRCLNTSKWLLSATMRWRNCLIASWRLAEYWQRRTLCGFT